MKRLLYLFLMLAGAGAALATTASVNVPITVTTGGIGNEVFVGPFANWLCVRTLASGTCGPAAGGYGTATGNGATDDTAAIQASINALSDTHPVLYFPAGTYRIAAALTLTSGNFVSLIGADALSTIISWGGAANSQAMLKSQGTHFSRVNRLTFNGNNNVGVLIQQSSDSGSFFDTGNEYADDVFTNAGGSYNGGVPVAFACGFTVGASALAVGNGCSEVSILRDRFVSGATPMIGAMTGNQNALDVWVWDSTFTGARIGLYENPGAIHAFRNNFSGSTVTDIQTTPSGVHTSAWNYSSSSNQFIKCPFNFGMPIIIEGNTVVNTTLGKAVDCGNLGPTIVLDNAFYSGAGTTPVVSQAASPSDLLSTGNTFKIIGGGIINACGSVSDYVQSTGRCHAVGDQTTSASAPPAPTLPGTPPQYCASGCLNTVSVFEVTTAGAIQTAINNAVATGNGAVVHIQAAAGFYFLPAKLTIPGNTFIQIIGDGYNTKLVAPGGVPAIECGTACKARLRDFEIFGNSNAGYGIKITGADQAGGRVFVEQPYLNSNVTNHLLVNGLTQGNAELRNVASMAAIGNGDAIKVVGPAAPSTGYTNLFAVASNCDNATFARISGYANLTIRQTWYDRGGCSFANHSLAQVTGGGSFSMAGALASVAGNPTTGHYFNLTNFSGKSSVIGIYALPGDAPADEFISGGVAGNNLSLGYFGCQAPIFTDTASGDAYYLLDPLINSPAGCNNGQAAAANVTEASQNVSDLLAFLNTTLAPLRYALPTTPGVTGDPALMSGITDARIYRVAIEQAIIAIDVEP